MKTNKFTAIYFMALFLSVSFLLQGQGTSQCQAVVTGLNGNVQIKKAGRPEFTKAGWGAQLFQNDQIRTDADSEATLTFSNGNLITLKPNSAITLSGDESPASPTGTGIKRVSKSMVINMSSLTSKRDDKKDAGVLAGLRTVEAEQPILPASPYNTLIKTNRPDFSWIPRKNYDRYIVNLYNSNGLLWSKRVSGTTMKFPENEKELGYGDTYFWNVEGEDILDNEKSPSHKFSVLSAEKSREVLEQEAAIRETLGDNPDNSSLHSFLGAYYLNQGLLQDAINEFEIVAQLNPESPLPHEILGTLYSDAGDKDKAIEELHKALSLSRNDKEK